MEDEVSLHECASKPKGLIIQLDRKAKVTRNQGVCLNLHIYESRDIGKSKQIDVSCMLFYFLTELMSIAFSGESNSNLFSSPDSAASFLGLSWRTRQDGHFLANQTEVAEVGTPGFTRFTGDHRRREIQDSAMHRSSLLWSFPNETPLSNVLLMFGILVVFSWLNIAENRGMCLQNDGKRSFCLYIRSRNVSFSVPGASLVWKRSRGALRRKRLGCTSNPDSGGDLIKSPYISIHDRRAETHERLYSIKVHRHRFARHARKVPFEKCEHWRKVCGRSAKDQIASTL